MIEYAAELINVFKIINKKLTQQEDLRGKHALRRLAEFGENVLLPPETWESGRMEKLEPKFEQGVCLGVCPRTDEAIIGTSAGIDRAGTVKQQAIEDTQGALAADTLRHRLSAVLPFEEMAWFTTSDI